MKRIATQLENRQVNGRFLFRLVVLAVFFTVGVHSNADAQTADKDDLRLLIVVSRHGARAPLEIENRKNEYNAQPWPKWEVAPGFLTPHGEKALERMGAFYRLQYPDLLTGKASCEFIYARANQVQRTIASAHSLLKGMTPQCSVPVSTLASDSAPALMRDPEVKELDPLFQGAFRNRVDARLSNAAVRGQVGNDLDRWAATRTGQLAIVDKILACPGCSTANPDPRRSLLEKRTVKPASVAGFTIPVDVGADLAQNIVLQYEDGRPMTEVGWGRTKTEDIRELDELTSDVHHLTARVPYSSRARASEMVDRLDRTLQQAATDKPVNGALGTASTRLLLLMGHDANLDALGGALNLQWLLPGASMNSTPPDSALVIELFRHRDSAKYYVRMRFEGQTIDQVRSAETLSLSNPAPSSPVFIPGCSTSEPFFPCELEQFHSVLRSSLDQMFVTTPVE